MQLWDDRVEVGELVVRRALVAHPLLGAAHAIEYAGATITHVSPIDWERPTRIPVIAEPARLPAGTGGIVLNAIAQRAAAAGVQALRYAGPYPTPALYHALARSFRASAPEHVFTADVLGRALRVARDEIAVDFAPAPHDRRVIARGFVEVRDGVERVVLDGVGYTADGSPARLIATPAGHAAELWFGDAVRARIAELDRAGAVIAGPVAPPAVTSDVIGKAFPAALREALAELVADVVPAPLADDARLRIATRTLAWADLGARAARATADGVAVHAMVWERIAPLGLARVALAVAEAVAPIVTQIIVGELSARAEP